jgi:hypothetical protein
MKNTEKRRTEQNRTTLPKVGFLEQNRTEQNRTEQNRTEQNRTEQNRTEQNRRQGIAMILYNKYKGNLELLQDLATVITNLFSAIPWIGPDLVEFIWGASSVDNPTLNRFFSLHFLLPFILAALVVAHLIALHVNASNNPNGISSTSDRIRFHPYFTSKDLVGLFWYGLILFSLVFFAPNLLGDSDNAIPANP